MSNLANLVGFDGLRDMKVSEELTPIITELTRRLEAFRNDLIHQLRSEPTVFWANPDTEPEKIAGSKAGDIAVWVDNTGISQIRVLT